MLLQELRLSSAALMPEAELLQEQDQEMSWTSDSYNEELDSGEGDTRGELDYKLR